jgi:hypothetical protein
MASVTILHAAENVLPARALADKLRELGLEVIMDLAPGDALREAERESLAAIALWSPQAARDGQLVAEAEHAFAQNKLVNARMQNAAAPTSVASAATVDLTGWRGQDDFTGWRTLAAELRGRAAAAATPPPRPPPPPPAPAARGGFFNPGAPPGPPVQPRVPPPPPDIVLPPMNPPPRAAPTVEAAPMAGVDDLAWARPTRTFEAPPRSQPRPRPEEREPGRPNLVFIGIVTFVAVALMGVGGYAFWGYAQAERTAAQAWEALDKTNPLALRAFLDGDHVGSFREEAEVALEGLEVGRLNEARATDTIESLEAFLRDFPESRHALEINGRIAELRVAPVAAPAAPAIDPATGLPIDPETGQPIDPLTGLPLAPAPAPAVEPPPLTASTGPDPFELDGPVPLTPPPAQDDGPVRLN